MKEEVQIRNTFNFRCPSIFGRLKCVMTGRRTVAVLKEVCKDGSIADRPYSDRSYAPHHPNEELPKKKVFSVGFLVFSGRKSTQ